jgi:signal transduction histidine kinase
MGIQGRISLLEEFSKGNNECVHHLEGMRYCIREASKLTKQMLGFAQSGKYKVGQVYLNDIARTVIESFNLNDKHIDIKTRLSPDLCPVTGDSRQLELVLMNLLLNAWQAIDDRGDITIKTENVTLSGTRLPRKDIKQLYWVKLSIQDNGCGIDSATMNRVFEPFYSTKDLERHRGLGLASAYGIIANHDGMIDIQSRLGAGTTVSLFLPAIDNK